MAANSGDVTLYPIGSQHFSMQSESAVTEKTESEIIAYNKSEISKFLETHPDRTRIDSDVTTWKGLLLACDGNCMRRMKCVLSNTERGRKAMGTHIIKEHGLRGDVETGFVNDAGEVIIVCKDKYDYRSG